MALHHTFNLFFTHPLTKHNPIKYISRFLVWQFMNKLIPYSVVFPFTTRAKLVIKKGMTGATGNLYYGLHEFNDMAFVLHALRPEDVFIDAGANVGSYTILASAHIGATSYSFEPDPQTFERLLDNISINRIADKVQLNNQALGKEKGTLYFTKGLDTVNHVVNSNFTNTQKIMVGVLDDLILPSDRVIIMKVDVEGFESEVLMGANNLLKNPNLKAIIMELNGSGGRYGYDEENIHKLLLHQGYTPYHYEPRERKFKDLNTFGSHNTIYIRDINYIQNRCITAEAITLHGISF